MRSVLSVSLLLSLFTTPTLAAPHRIGLVADRIDRAIFLSHHLDDGYCGFGRVGNGICKDAALCCSKWGYCGSTDEYCSVKAEVKQEVTPEVKPQEEEKKPDFFDKTGIRWGHKKPHGGKKNGGEKTEQKPVEQKPAEEKPVEQKPAEEKPVEQKPADEKPEKETKPSENNNGNTDFGSLKRGYATYHMYEASTPTSSIACSDGPNGLLTTHSYKNLAPLFPYVSAASFAGHSSPQCGTCWRLVGPKGSITVSVIDQCGEQSGYDAHFDIAPEAFNKLSDQGHQDGHVEVGYMQVPKDYCLGLFGY